MLDYYLKCLGIIHWRLREPENSLSQPIIYSLKREGQACLYLVAEPCNSAESELFAKIAAATALEATPVSADELKAASLPILAFGASDLSNKSLIPLPALGQLLNSVEMKRQVWGVLKNLCL